MVQDVPWVLPTEMRNLPNYRPLDVMKFHHLGHTLLDSNCLLLCLRLLGLQEVSTYVITKNEIPERK